MRAPLIFVIFFSLLLMCCTPFKFSRPTKEKTKLIEIGSFYVEDLAVPVAEIGLQVVAGEKIIFLRIDSLGGEVALGMRFIRYLEDLKRTEGIRVKCVVDLQAQSMAFYFLQAVCDERLATNRAIFMAHKGYLPPEIIPTEQTLLYLNITNLYLMSIGSSRSKVSFEEFSERLSKGEWIMGSKEALGLGFIDRIILPSELPPTP